MLFNSEQRLRDIAFRIRDMALDSIAIDGSDISEVVAELRSQGLTVTLHNPSHQTWYIAGDGIYEGYVATGDELVELKRKNALTLRGVRSLG